MSFLPSALCVLSHFSCVWLCDSMDYSLPAPLSMGFSRQEYWSGLPCPSPGDLPNPGIKPESLTVSCIFIAITQTTFSLHLTDRNALQLAAVIRLFSKQNIIILPPPHGRITPLWDGNSTFTLKREKVILWPVCSAPARMVSPWASGQAGHTDTLQETPSCRSCQGLQRVGVGKSGVYRSPKYTHTWGKVIPCLLTSQIFWLT